MSQTTSSNSSNSTTTAAVPDTWENIPCVQYGFPEGKGSARAPKLRSIFEPIPDNAETASPVYLLSRNQYERQDDFESGYEVKGYKMIATELQDKCEADDRVLYPVHIESDVYHEEGPSTLIEWFCEFIEDQLDVPFNTCTLYFSGNRSIHVHVPRFVSGERARERLKQQAETFCEETDAELDCGLYSRKRMFRLPDVEHAKTGLPKVEIEPEWNHNRIFREANEATPDVPESYEAVLRRVFLRSSLIEDEAQLADYTCNALFRVLDSEKTILDFESDERDIETPLIEQVKYPDDPAVVPEWAQYNAKEFSPYALADEGGRSVAIVKVKGGAFCRRNVQSGAALIPAYFYGAHGCTGDDFTKHDEHAPIQLSARDYEKWEYEEGDDVVIIGGRSRNSRIFDVAPSLAPALGDTLVKEEGSRRDALALLESQGYDIGEAGRARPAEVDHSNGRHSQRTDSDDATAPRTGAGKLQQQAEQEGIETLSHSERWRVGCRLLKRGWEPAWEWFRAQYSDEFKPDVTWGQLRSAVESYPDDYRHVEVPVKP
jgi:hypothetical protein